MQRTAGSTVPNMLFTHPLLGRVYRLAQLRRGFYSGPTVLCGEPGKVVAAPRYGTLVQRPACLAAAPPAALE
jgi:hypothetical protein